MKANYHTHTARCHHAHPDERRYIECAIEGGFSLLGFADHVPQPFRDGYVSGIRMHPDETADYVGVLSALKEEYRGRIDVRIGFETEYLPSLFEDLLRLLEPHPYEYLILGQHFMDNEAGGLYMGLPFDSEATLSRYVDQCAEAMDTGAFCCFAHPDLPNFQGSETFYRAEMRRLCRYAKGCGMPLEFNLLGYEMDKQYPSPKFWEEAAAVGATAILGWDAHEPTWLARTDVETRARAYLQSLDVHPVDALELIRPHAKEA